MPPAATANFEDKEHDIGGVKKSRDPVAACEWLEATMSQSFVSTKHGALANTAVHSLTVALPSTIYRSLTSGSSRNL